MMRKFLYTVLFSLFPITAFANCGGDFGQFVANLRAESAQKGFSKADIAGFFSAVAHSPAVIKADRRQGVFQKDFISFSNALISEHRKAHAKKNAQKFPTTFDKIEQKYGIPRGVLLAFWAFETDFGANQGNFNTLNALITLAHDCRRPDLFRGQIFAALELYTKGGFDPVQTKGAWAGEIGMVQMLPADILRHGIDGDGDGRVDMQNSAADALLSTANLMDEMGWQAGKMWLQQVRVPQGMDWAQTGLDKPASLSEWARKGVRTAAGTALGGQVQAALLLPVGHKGPAFLAHPNFNAYLEWNQSLTYVLTAAYFATLIEGGPPYAAGTPDAGLSGAEMKVLQNKLKTRGHDVGKVDGILGAKTRAAVQKEQARLGLPADAWPTKTFLDML